MNALHRDPASAGSRRVRAAVIALGIATVLTSCRSPFADDDLDASPTRSADLAEPATDDPVDVAPDDSPERAAEDATNGGPPPTGGTAETNTSSIPADPDPGSAPSTDESALVRIGDPKGDGGSRPYADALLLAVDDLGDRGRFTVRLAGEVPRVLSSNEVMGIGIDLFVGSRAESDYQLFADGGSDGWRAFLQTPTGFVAFPGVFRVGADLVQFEVPWSSIGNQRAADVTAFVDWGAPNSLGLVERSSDFVPDREPGSILGG